MRLQLYFHEFCLLSGFSHLPYKGLLCNAKGFASRLEGHLFLSETQLWDLLNTADPLSTFRLLRCGNTKAPQLKIIDFVNKHLDRGIYLPDRFRFKFDLKDARLVRLESWMVRDDCKVRDLLKWYINLWVAVLVLYVEGQFSRLSHWAITKFKQVCLDLNLRTNRVGFQLDYNRVIALWGHHHTVLMNVLRFEISWIFLVVDRALLVAGRQRVRSRVNVILVVYFCSAVEVDLKFLERLDWGRLGLHKHHSFTLLATYFTWSLNIDELLGWD